MTLHGALAVAIEVIGRLWPALLAALALLLAERRWPWRPAQPQRRVANLGLGALSFITVLLLPLASMTAAAQWAAAHSFGLLHHLQLPLWLQLMLSVVALDFALYVQHRALHSRGLWALHRMHHTDPMLDFTSGVRFHPVEAGVSAFFKSLVVLLIGAPVLAVAISASLTLLASLFTHANIRLPLAAERPLRWLFITPSLHRIHHSTVAAETQSNFGSVLWIWDRWLGSARAQPAQGAAMQLGVAGQTAQTTLPAMLAEPFRRRPR